MFVKVTFAVLIDGCLGRFVALWFDFIKTPNLINANKEQKKKIINATGIKITVLSQSTKLTEK
jgi:hypothetical protein